MEEVDTLTSWETIKLLRGMQSWSGPGPKTKISEDSGLPPVTSYLLVVTEVSTNLVVAPSLRVIQSMTLRNRALRSFDRTVTV
jgi:hypothetical protein